jgi:hypothetical protein
MEPAVYIHIKFVKMLRQSGETLPFLSAELKGVVTH